MPLGRTDLDIAENISMAISPPKFTSSLHPWTCRFLEAYDRQKKYDGRYLSKKIRELGGLLQGIIVPKDPREFISPTLHQVYRYFPSMKRWEFLLHKEGEQPMKREHALPAPSDSETPTETKKEVLKMTNKEEQDSTFTEELLRIIKQQELTYAAFGRKHGLSPRAFRHWIDGKNYPSLESFNDLAKCYPQLERYRKQFSFEIDRRPRRRSNFRKDLLNYRIAAGETRTSLSKKLKVGSAIVGKWERGNRYPTIESMRKLVAIFPQLSIYLKKNRVKKVKPTTLENNQVKSVKVEKPELGIDDLGIFAKKLRGEIEKSGMTLVDFSRSLGRSQTIVYNWVEGRNWPSPEMHAALVEKFPALKSVVYKDPYLKRSDSLKDHFKSVAIEKGVIMTDNTKSFSLIMFGRKLDRFFSGMDDNQIKVTIEFLEKSNEAGMTIQQVVSLMKDELDVRNIQS